MIAGDGELPVDIARAAAAAGREIVVVAFPGITRPAIEGVASQIAWLSPGAVDAALRFLAASGAREAVMAGKVSKQALVGGQLEVDDRARRILSRLTDWNDATLLTALAGEIEAEGIALLPQAELVPDWVAPVGPLGEVNPTLSQWEQIRLGWPVARAVASLDIGQTLVVHERAIVAVEAIEGTDEAIRRAGRLVGAGSSAHSREGLCIVKVARPNQDPRFDLPAIGVRTVAVAAEAGAAVIAIEAGSSLVLERQKVVEYADSAGIALVGVPAEGPGADSGSRQGGVRD